MLFNSLQFAVFFVVVYSLYLVLDHRWQNRMLLAASYVFYAAWDWRFLSLIVISTLLDYFCGIEIHRSPAAGRRRLYLFFSVFGNLGILGFFKYFNFFSSSLQILLKHFGLSADPRLLHIVLPVGISFYTFQTMSYTIDVYKREIEPTKRFFDFALFVAFFPQLVAGPIERAKHLLPQVLNKRVLSLEKFYEGGYLIYWGLFQKIFVADNLARIVDPVFAAGPPYSGLPVVIALYAFAFQIYCDFAGYSNIARGLGRCLGFDIMVNFNLPYFAVNPRDFWQRWHISLSTWLRDYLYIPLGGNRRGVFRTQGNLILTMLLGGLWHGAAWTFILWGAYQGILLIAHRWGELFFKRWHCPPGPVISKIYFAGKVFVFFHLMCLGWLIFRARSAGQIGEMLRAVIFNFDLRSLGANLGGLFSFIFFVWLLILVQWWQFWKKDLMVVYRANILVKAVFYVLTFYLMSLWGVAGAKQFIYFQF
ncbi:MAG: MBOAT family O-acyltransferase [Candidatus Omnitrophota bacterium]